MFGFFAMGFGALVNFAVGNVVLGGLLATSAAVCWLTAGGDDE